MLRVATQHTFTRTALISREQHTCYGCILIFIHICLLLFGLKGKQLGYDFHLSGLEGLNAFKVPSPTIVNSNLRTSKCEVTY